MRLEGIKDVGLYLALGYVYGEESKNDKALKFYTAALEMAPDDARIHFHLGVQYDKMKERFLAVKEFREAIRLDPKFSDAYNYLGYMFAEEGSNLDEAIVLVRKALEIEPENGAFLDSLGCAYFQKGDTSEAFVELKKAIKFEPNDPTIRDHLGDIYFKKGLRDKAREEWERSLKIDPKQDKVREKLKKRRRVKTRRPHGSSPVP